MPAIFKKVRRFMMVSVSVERSFKDGLLRSNLFKTGGMSLGEVLGLQAVSNDWHATTRLGGYLFRSCFIYRNPTECQVDGPRISARDVALPADYPVLRLFVH